METQKLNLTLLIRTWDVQNTGYFDGGCSFFVFSPSTHAVDRSSN